METIKGLIKSLINGGIGAIVGAAFATALDSYMPFVEKFKQLLKQKK